LNFDVRDLAFWFKEAQKKLLQNQIKAIQAARYAQANNSDYQEIMTGLQSQISKIEFGEEKVVKENWNELRKMKRG
jgi:hypothetical protein